MNKHIGFPSIEQFRNIVKYITDNCKYHNKPLPILQFTGTVKLHGTNHAVCMSPAGEIYTQSRERCTSPGDDNAGSAAWTAQHLKVFESLFAGLKNRYLISPNETIQVFGEWCGGNIQKGVGLNNVPKTFIVFAIRISADAESQEFLSDVEVVKACTGLLKTIFDFTTFNIAIDFNYPEKAQEYLQSITEEVERDCPVSRQLLGKDFVDPLIGEGVVWATVYNNNTLRFKVKGEKHSSSRVKTLASVDIEKLDSIKEFVASVVTESRLTQGLEHVESREPKNTGAFLKWVMSDIYKEELDTMNANGFTSKEVSPHLSAVIRTWFLA